VECFEGLECPEIYNDTTVRNQKKKFMYTTSTLLINQENCLGLISTPRDFQDYQKQQMEDNNNSQSTSTISAARNQAKPKKEDAPGYLCFNVQPTHSKEEAGIRKIRQSGATANIHPRTMAIWFR
jgi:hypothetical protein